MNADQTHTIRLPTGVASRLKAATGQPLSFLVRCMCMALLHKYEAEGVSGSVKAKVRAEVADVIANTNLTGEPSNE